MPLAGAGLAFLKRSMPCAVFQQPMAERRARTVRSASLGALRRKTFRPERESRVFVRAITTIGAAISSLRMAERRTRYVLTHLTLEPNYSLKRTDQSLRD